MQRPQLVSSLLLLAFVIAVWSASGLVNASALAQATNTRRPTRNLTTNPRATATNTRRPTRNLTTNPRATATNSPRPTRDLTANPRATRTATDVAMTETPTATVVPTSDSTNQDAGLPDALTSQLLILNPDRNGTARVSVNIFDLNGAVAFSNTVKIKENGARIVTVPKSLGADFLGSARIVADRRVQALVLDRTTDGAASDAYEVANTLTNALTLPYVQHGANSSPHTFIAIQNISALSAEAAFTAFDSSGNEILSHPLTIPARASAYVDTAELFGANSFLGSARITANQNIAAAAITTRHRDTASLRAFSTRDEDSSLVVPQVERKFNKKNVLTAWNEMYIRNNGDALTDVTIAFYNPNGKLRGSVTRTNVPAGGLIALETRAEEFEFLGSKFAGWAAVTSSAETPLLVHAFMVRGRGKHFVAVGGAARARIDGRNVCGDIRSTVNHSSVITLLNARPKKKAIVRLRFYERKSGALVSESTRELAPGAQISITPQNELPPNFQGIAIIGAEQNLSRKILASVSTQTRSGKRATSTNGYVCR